MGEHLLDQDDQKWEQQLKEDSTEDRTAQLKEPPTQGPQEMCLLLEHQNLSNTWKNGLFWSRYSFVAHSIDRKPWDWGLVRLAYSIKYRKGGNKFGAYFQIAETHLEFNEIAWFY